MQFTARSSEPYHLEMTQPERRALGDGFPNAWPSGVVTPNSAGLPAKTEQEALGIVGIVVGAPYAASQAASSDHLVAGVLVRAGLGTKV